ncbi:hypothetical protein Q3G72_011622 [Acer saccharum]|nr:hypothetical protein Q3G72_011622 [Acer saccharum]
MQKLHQGAFFSICSCCCYLIWKFSHHSCSHHLQTLQHHSWIIGDDVSQHYGWKSEKDSYSSHGGQRENRVPSKLLTRVLEKIVTSKLLQLGVIAFTHMSNGVFADPSADTSTVASPAIHAVAASYRYSGSAYDPGIHAF